MDTLQNLENKRKMQVGYEAYHHLEFKAKSFKVYE